jgi:hypothetical protein
VKSHLRLVWIGSCRLVLGVVIVGVEKILGVRQAMCDLLLDLDGKVVQLGVLGQNRCEQALSDPDPVRTNRPTI